MMNIDVIQQIALTVIVPVAVQVLKKADSVQFLQPGQTARIRSVVGVSMFVGTAVIAYLDGNLSSFISPEMVQVAAVAGLSWLMAHIGYKTAGAVKSLTQ